MGPTEIQLGRRGFLAAGLAVTLAGCGAGSPGGAASAGVPTRSFVFADAAAPGSLDPSLDNSLETSRISAQIFECLVRADRSTGEPQPGLAESWEFSEDRLAVTFVLREGITFHDGSPLDAQAVRTNFDKWRSQAESGTVWSSPTPFAAVFRHGSADPSTPSSFGGCEVVDERTVRLTLRHSYTPLLKALTQPAFGIASPAGIAARTTATQPVGTGPFKFRAADGQAVTLEVNPEYWSELGDIGTLEFRAIPDAHLRYAALVAGQVDAYDLVGLDAFAPLARSGTQVLFRDPYSVSYVGINQRTPLMRDLAVRRAVAAAIDRGALARTLFPSGTHVADQFVPARFNVDGENLKVPGFNPQRAKDLLAESTYDGELLPFYYPRNTSRIYLQQPERVYSAVSQHLTRAGFNLDPVAIDWQDDYVGKVSSPESSHALCLLGWSGGFRDPDGFLGPLVSAPNPQFGLRDPGLFTAVNRAAALPDGAARARAYRTLNDRISQSLPAVPLTHPLSAVAVNQRVQSFPLTSSGHELFNDLELVGS